MLWDLSISLWMSVVEEKVEKGGEKSVGFGQGSPVLFWVASAQKDRGCSEGGESGKSVAFAGEMAGK